MKKTILLVVMALMGLSSLMAQSISDGVYPRIDVRGYAEKKVAPDIFNVVVTFGESKEFLGKQNIEDLEQKVIKVLREAGLDIKKDVSVTSGTSRGEENRVYIQKTIEFKVDSYEKYYAIARSLDFKGIQNVRLSSMRYSRENEVKMELMPVSVANARKIAEALMKGSGMSIGRPIYVNALGLRVIYPESEDAIVSSNMMMAYGARKSSYEYMEKSRDITITVDVQVSYELKDSE